MDMKSYLSMHFVVVGHRGLSSTYIENTYTSFEKAFEYTDVVELDVHLSKDNHVYVIHDFNLKNITGLNKVVENLKSYEIDEIKIENENIPSLEYILKNFPDKYFFIELKSIDDSGNLVKNDIEKETIKVIKKYKMENHVCVISFNPYSLRNMHILDRNIFLGLDYADTSEKYMGKIKYEDLNELGISVFLPEYNTKNLQDFVNLKNEGIYVIPWTVDDEKSANEINSSNLNGFITNKVDILSKFHK